MITGKTESKHQSFKTKRMKQFIPIFSLAILMTACTSNPKTASQVDSASQTQQTPALNPDTVGLAQFQQWKAAHELAAAAEYKTPVKQQATAAPVKKAKTVYAAPRPQTSGSTTASGNSSGTNEAGTINSESSNTAKAAEKKGWSKAAKGTAIGAGTGAAVGAVINKKNRVAGGVIGGVVGGAVGYGLGRHMDKQDGRY
jgi:hypothetical protein